MIIILIKSIIFTCVFFWITETVCNYFERKHVKEIKRLKRNNKNIIYHNKCLQRDLKWVKEDNISKSERIHNLEKYIPVPYEELQDDYTPPIEDIHELRLTTGHGLHNCKLALIQTKGDLKEAVEWLRNYGNA